MLHTQPYTFQLFLICPFHKQSHCNYLRTKCLSAFLTISLAQNPGKVLFQVFLVTKSVLQGALCFSKQDIGRHHALSCRKRLHLGEGIVGGKHLPLFTAPHSSNLGELGPPALGAYREPLWRRVCKAFPQAFASWEGFTLP